MIAISPLRVSNGDGGFPTAAAPVEFSDDFSGDNLQLEDIDFDDLFVGFDIDGDLLPDLDLDPAEILEGFSVGEEDRGTTTATTSVPPAIEVLDDQTSKVLLNVTETREDERSVEVMSVLMERDELTSALSGSSSSAESTDRGRKSSAKGGSHGKRKVKVDWTPELHRRFVQAVEQLGVDKAVPSRILELMGIDCLTRHNIASHLQKYRSHRKHLLAREAEAASWSRRRQMYAGHGASGATAKREINHHPWVAPTMGFPPAPVPAFRPPLHVWGHPSTMDQSLVPVWPKHLVRPPPPQWIAPPLPPPPITDPSYWHHHHYPRVPTTAMTPFFPHPIPAARFPPPLIQAVAPLPMYRQSSGAPPPPPPSKHFEPQFQLDDHQAKENIDAAIGDALTKPWLPLPLGLKPPSLESVMGKLQRQGVSAIPPSCC